MSLSLRNSCSSSSLLGKLKPGASSEITRAVMKQAEVFIFCGVVEVVSCWRWLEFVAVCHFFSELLLLYPAQGMSIRIICSKKLHLYSYISRLVSLTFASEAAGLLGCHV